MLNHKSVYQTLQELETLEQQLENLQTRYNILQKIKTEYELKYKSVKKINDSLVDLLSDVWVELDERKLNDVY